MSTIRDVIEQLEQIAPRKFQESYDNAGLIVGKEEWEVTGILVALDSTEAIIQEAKSLGCNLVIAHHPIIFKGLKQINGKHYVERTVIQAIKNDIAVYAIHTNLDNVFYQGVNQKIGQKIGLINMEILAPKKGLIHESQVVGSGIIGEFTQPVETSYFLTRLKERMKVNVIRHTLLLKHKIQKVAVCGGAGSFLVRTAIAKGADIFVSADFKYHEFFEANDQIIIADIGHYESEQFTIELLTQILSDKFSIFAVHSTKLCTNPVYYL